MLLELGRLRLSVVSPPFSVGEDGYEDGKLAASSDSHDSLEEGKQFETAQGAETKLQAHDRRQKKYRSY